MHREVLTGEQIKLLPLLKSFSKDFGLVGGTAVALNIGHRRSIDFDLFTREGFDNFGIRRKILRMGKIERVFVSKLGEFTISVSGVRITFFHYPFRIGFPDKFNNVISLSDLLTLGAMKAFALGQRVKWKDYVDLYFIMGKYRGITPVVKRAQKIFSSEFNEKMFRAQLAYFKDIDYTEKIIYMRGFKTDDKTIKDRLTRFSLS